MATLNIPEDTFRQLAEKAAARNTSVEEMVLAMLDQLIGRETANGKSPHPSSEDRKRAFEEWTGLIENRASRYPPNHVLDDSREAIYGERENAQL